MSDPAGGQAPPSFERFQYVNGGGLIGTDVPERRLSGQSWCLRTRNSSRICELGARAQIGPDKRFNTGQSV
jgi:hypothetical protein